MKKFWLILGISSGIGLCTFMACKTKPVAPEKAIAQQLVAQIDDFDAANKQLIAGIEDNQDRHQLEQLFLQSRLAYKKFEWAAEYFNPSIVRLLNGPPVQELEPVSRQVFEPEGLQVIEALLYPKYNAANKQELISRIKKLALVTAKYKVYFNNIDLLSGQVFDAAKLEVYRIISLGIAGFDDPLSLNSMNEAAGSLQSLQAVMDYYADSSQDLHDKLQESIDYLQKNTSFNDFNRALFITAYGNKITIGISRLERQLNIPIIKYNRLLHQDAETLFDKNAFDPDAYAPCAGCLTSIKKVALGKKLFSDPILSGTQTRSCASCHQPERAFTDGLVTNTEITGKGLLRRNTPTLLNAGLQPSQFYDIRADGLEAQAKDVMQNKLEMHGPMDISVRRLQHDKTYPKLFAEAYPDAETGGIDTMQVMNALAAYLRSLTKLNSRFDDYMRGNSSAMGAQEIDGFNLFMGKARCGTCHYMPLFNGTLPPAYTRIETEVIGVPQTKDHKAIDKDMGRYEIFPMPFLQHSFKVTTVRNAALTAPYMHNGVFNTLAEVMDFYNKGGGAGLGLPVKNQTLAPDRLHLTTKETDAVIAFIKSLNSR